MEVRGGSGSFSPCREEICEEYSAGVLPCFFIAAGGNMLRRSQIDNNVIPAKRNQR